MILTEMCLQVPYTADRGHAVQEGVPNPALKRAFLEALVCLSVMADGSTEGGHALRPTPLVISSRCSPHATSPPGAMAH